MAKAAHDRDDFDGETLVFYFEVVGDEGVVFEADRNHLPVSTHIKA